MDLTLQNDRTAASATLVVQPSATPTQESTELGHKLLISDAALAGARSFADGEEGRRAKISGATAASIETASVRLVNTSRVNLYFQIQSNRRDEYYCLPENGTIRARSTVVVAVAYRGVESNELAGNAVFRCKWGLSKATAGTAGNCSKFKLKFSPTMLSLPAATANDADSCTGGSATVNKGRIDEDHSSSVSGGCSCADGDNAVIPDQKGWPPWERSDYTGNNPSAEDVDAERSAAYKFIAAADAAKLGYTDSSTMKESVRKELVNRETDTVSSTPAGFCYRAVKSIVLQGMLIFAVLGALTFSFPKRTGGLTGVFTRESVVLPSFLVGMLAQWLRTWFFSVATSGSFSRVVKSKTE